MSGLKVLSLQSSPHLSAQARGKLFEKLVAEVLRHLGFRIDKIANVNYSGMEIDVEGRSIVADTPLYAECKCCETPVDAPKFQAFYGKYTSRWRRDKRAQGIFLALPGLNSHAKAFYRDNCEPDQEMTVRLLEEDSVLRAIYESKLAVHPSAIEAQIPRQIGLSGDSWLLFSDKGYFWIQLVTRTGVGVPDTIALFDGFGRSVTDNSTIEYLTQLDPDLLSFSRLQLDRSSGVTPDARAAEATSSESDEIVQVRGSSSWFEYQFPASPEHFVGRTVALEDVLKFAAAVISKTTSSRSLLFEANSGWGKSSLALTTIARFRRAGHLGVVIDCRSISTSSSILQVVDYALSQLAGNDDEPSLFSPHSTHERITGFEGAAKALISFGLSLEKRKLLACIFLDQFENLFFLPDALRRIRDLLAAISDAQTNIVLGFAWKSDLIGTTSEFPFQLRDAIAECSKRLTIDTFSEVETNALLDKLRSELRTQLRKDLRFLLSEFSQGYPWLLKKLCAHVKSQRDSGVAQIDIASKLLNIEELFQEDLRGLSPEQQEALHRIAKVAPVAVSELSDQFTPDVLQILVNRRLIVRVGHKYDIYWDIFRDYINTNKVPVQENYMLRVQVGAVFKAVTLLANAGGTVPASDFSKRAGLSENSAFNVLRDFRMLGIALTLDSEIRLQIPISKATKEAELIDQIRVHLRDRLVRNRFVSRIIASLKLETSILEERVARLLENWCPYVSATPKTWRMYAHILSTWLDLADLALYDHKTKLLSYYAPSPTAELRKRDVHIPTRRRSGGSILSIQFTPVEKLALEVASALKGVRPKYEQFRKTTLSKGFGVLEDLKLLERTQKGYRVSPMLDAQFLQDEKVRRKVFATAILKIDAFQTFLKVLEKYSLEGASLSQLGAELKSGIRVDWKQGTSETNAKIMLDWARGVGLAPGVFVASKRGKWKRKSAKNGAHSKADRRLAHPAK
jgi:hypothetical protein